MGALYKEGGMFNPSSYRSLTISNCLDKVVKKKRIGDLSSGFRVKVLL